MVSMIHSQIYCVGSFEHNNHTGMVCEGMWRNSCGGRERYVGEWREEVVEVGEWVGEVGGGGGGGVGRRDGRKGT